MQELLDALATEFRTFASEAAETYVTHHPRGFALYSVPLSDDGLRALVGSWDVQDWDWLCDEVRGLALVHLRELAEAGRVAALTSGPNVPEWREAARQAGHPLVRLMADAEFGGALAEEAELALEQAATLPGWSAERPSIVRCAV